MVMLPRFAFAATVSALFIAAAADLKIISPGGPDLWWVAKSQNVISWTCNESPYGNFTILVANKNPAILVAPMAVVAIENNFDCSKTITQDQASQAPGTGYTIQLANILNQTDVYAESQEFEIKPLGAAYPAASATPTSAKASATGSGAAPAASTKSSATGLKASLAFGVAVAAAVLGVSTI